MSKTNYSTREDYSQIEFLIKSIELKVIFIETNEKKKSISAI